MKPSEGCWVLERRYLTERLLNLANSHFTETEHWIRKAIEARKRNWMVFHLDWTKCCIGTSTVSTGSARRP